MAGVLALVGGGIYAALQPQNGAMSDQILPERAGNPNLEFIVRFNDNDKDLTEAVKGYANDPDAAAIKLDKALKDHSAFNRLVVHAVTLGGEVVFRYDASAPVDDVQAVSSGVIARLRADPAVEYADPNIRAGLGAVQLDTPATIPANPPQE
jgi:hypothetical protein